MPMITVHSLPVKDPSTITPMLREICTAGGRALGRPARALRAFYVEIDPGHYVEGEAETPDHTSHPPVVFVRLLKGRTQDLKQAFAEAITTAVSRATGVPHENVWIHFQDMEPDDLWRERRFGT